MDEKICGGDGTTIQDNTRQGVPTKQRRSLNEK